MDNLNLKKDLTEVYEQFFQDLCIDPKTGVLGVISNNRLKNQLGRIRFSGYPFVGSNYSSAKTKILVVGLDIGVDELDDENTFHSFESRNCCIEPVKQAFNKYNIHISGTYGIVFYLLKEYYGWEDIWNAYFSGKIQPFKTIIDRLGSTVLPYEVLSYISFTNLHKFVTIKRHNRSGDENRKWYNPIEEKQLFLKELRLFSPDIVYIQGQSKFDPTLLASIKKEGYRIVLSDHPSSWRNGANIPTYVEKLTYINW